MNIDIDDLNHTLYVIASKLHAQEAFVKHFKEDTIVALADFVFHDKTGSPQARLQALKAIQNDVENMPTPRVGRVIELAKVHVKKYVSNIQAIDLIVASVAEDEEYLRKHRERKDQKEHDDKKARVFKKLKD